MAETQEAEIEHRAEHGRAERAAEAAGEQEGRGHAAAFGPVDDFLDQDDRGAREQAHAEPHDRASRRPATTGELSWRSAMNTSAPAGTSAPPSRSTARTPKRRKPRTPTVAPIGQPSTIADRAKPATSGDFCITPCTNTGRNVVSPIITMPHQKRGAVGRGDRPAAPELERDHRLRRPALLQHEQRNRDHSHQGGEVRSRAGPRSKARSDQP